MKYKPALLHFKFEDFEEIPYFVDNYSYLLSGPQADCNGHEWQIKLSVGGYDSFRLYMVSRNYWSPDAHFTVSIKSANGDTVKSYTCNEFDCGPDHLYSSGVEIKNSVILNEAHNVLSKGILHIDVGIQVIDERDHVFQPKSDHADNMLKLLKSGEKSDAFFNVKDKQFRVHSLIIYANAPILANDCNGDIKNIKPKVFQLLLEYIYSGCIPEKRKILKNGKELIDAANRYELVELKMCVENVLVQERVVTNENVADYILFADAQCCPLLKEYAMVYFSTHCREVLKSEHSKCLKESGELMSEIMLHMHSENQNIKAMTVSELRNELGKRKLDVDGSKETLTSRLEQAKRQRTELLLV